MILFVKRGNSLRQVAFRPVKPNWRESRTRKTTALKLFARARELANSDLLMEVIDGGNCNSVERMARCWHSLLLPEVQSRCYKSFVICTVYRPPSTPLNFMDDLANSLIESLLSGLDVIILGDLNCNLLQDNAESRALNDFCSTFNLTQLINKPTRATENGESLIDVVMTRMRN